LSIAGQVTAESAQSPRLGVDERLQLLLDRGSVLEVAAQARSQQPSVAADTPADGVRTLLARIRDINVAVIAEDGQVLERTDGEVARAKRHRILDLARMTGVPVILLLDGPAASPGRFDPNAGQLAGHLSDPRLDIDLRQRAAPLISVVCGRVVGWARAVLGESDVVIATADASRELDSGMAAAADIIAAGEADAIEQAATVLQLLVGGRSGSAKAEAQAQVEADSDVAALSDDQWMDARLSASECVQQFADVGSFVPFTTAKPDVTTGLAAIARWPLAVVCVGGSERAILAKEDLRRISRLYRLSRRNGLPLLVLENCAGLDGDALSSYEQLAELTAELRESNTLKVNVITGAGHALGTFPLGSRQLRIDYFVAWPWADISIIDPPTDYSPESLDAVRNVGPWLAAGRGLVDDILTPAQSIEAVRWIVDLYMSNRDS
jgi:acetyl-CoA carboxylase carboxyltransferase component